MDISSRLYSHRSITLVKGYKDCPFMIFMEYKPAVIISDMQHYFLTDIFEDSTCLIHSHKTLIDYCSKNDIPVVLVEKLCDKDIEVPNSILDSFNVVPRKRNIMKLKDNAFTEPELEEQLDMWGSNYLCVTGIYQARCVATTITAAIEKGKYRICTSRDLLGNFKDDIWLSIEIDEWYNHTTDYFSNVEEVIKNLDIYRSY